jgi:hypothetical protein
LNSTKPKAGNGSALEINMEVESREHHPHPSPEVTITIDNKKYEVHRGKISVAELKQLGGISPAYELEEIIDGKLVPLKDDQHVEIKGGEQFVGHPRAGASS